MNGEPSSLFGKRPMMLNLDTTSIWNGGNVAAL